METLTFPDPREQARRRAEAFQRLSPEQRFKEITALMAFGWAMIRSSPRRAEIEKRMQEQEAELRKIYQELFAGHGG